MKLGSRSDVEHEASEFPVWIVWLQPVRLERDCGEPGAVSLERDCVETEGEAVALGAAWSGFSFKISLILICGVSA